MSEIRAPEVPSIVQAAAEAPSPEPLLESVEDWSPAPWYRKGPAVHWTVHRDFDLPEGQWDEQPAEPKKAA